MWRLICCIAGVIVNAICLALLVAKAAQLYTRDARRRRWHREHKIPSFKNRQARVDTSPTARPPHSALAFRVPAKDSRKSNGVTLPLLATPQTEVRVEGPEHQPHRDGTRHVFPVAAARTAHPSTRKTARPAKIPIYDVTYEFDLPRPADELPLEAGFQYDTLALAVPEDLCDESQGVGPSAPHTPIKAVAAPQPSTPQAVRHAHQARSGTSVPAHDPTPGDDAVDLAVDAQWQARPVAESPVLWPEPYWPTAPHTEAGAKKVPLKSHVSAVISGPEEISVLCYNVRCDKDAAPFSWLQRRKHVVAAIQETGMAIACLQEAKQAYAHELCRALGSRWRLAGVPRRIGDEGTQILYDTAVFSFIETSTWVFHDEGVRLCPPTTHCTEQSFLGRRRCAHVRIFTHAVLVHDATGLPINVINTHFPLEEQEQEICARQLAAYVLDRTDMSWPTIICGDFNSHYAPKSFDTPMALLLKALPGLADAHRGQDFPTYHEGFEGDVLPPGKRAHTVQQSHRLDYVLVRVPGNFPVRLDRGDVHHPRYLGIDGKSYRPSDHEPISASFVVSGDTAGFSL